MVLGLIAEAWSLDVSSLIVALAIILAPIPTIALTIINKRRECSEHRAAEMKMLLDAHMNLWRGLLQMEAHAMGLPNKDLSDGRHAMRPDDFNWLRDTLRNSALMLDSKIHEEYNEMLTKGLKWGLFRTSDMAPGGAYDTYAPFSEICLADLSEMQRIAKSRWETYAIEYCELGGKYPSVG